MEVSSTTKETSKVLQGVCAYVEVRSKCENRSNVIAEELRKLGAQINEKLNVNVTHVVFKDGTNRTLERAKKLDIPLVSVLWVDSCKKTLEHVSESAFPVESPNKDQEEKLRLFPVKRTKFRSMQPKDLTEEFEESSQRCHRRRKRTDKNKNKNLQSSYSSAPALSPMTPCSFDLMPHITTPPSMKAKLLERSKHEEAKESSCAEEDTDDLKKELFKNTSPFSFPTLLSHSQSTSSISCQRNLSEILPHNLLSELPCTTSLKERSNSFGILSDVKPFSENISNSKKSLKVNEQRTVAEGSSQQTQKWKSVCDSTSNHHSESSSPLSSISANTCNLSMEDFIINKPVHRKRYKHRETLNILGVTESNLHGIKHSMSNSDQSKKAEMSEAKDLESATVPQTLSSSKAELMTCHKKLKENGAPFCSTPADKDNGCTQSNVEERLQQEFDCLKTNGVNYDNLSQSSSQSLAFSVSQTSSLLLAPESQNQGQSLSTAKEKSIPAFQKPIKKYLVMTSMSTSEQEIVKSVAKALGGSIISDHVRKSTTHVICGNARRTLNLLYGLTQGCWLVSKQWIFKSMEAGQWINEQMFEMTDDYPAAKVYRQNKQKNRSLPIFKNYRPMFISTSTAPPRKDLVHFVQFCGGQVKNNMCDAVLYVGDEFNPSMLSVSPQWILDSITHQKALPLENYRLGQPKPPSPEY